MGWWGLKKSVGSKCLTPGLAIVSLEYALGASLYLYVQAVGDVLCVCEKLALGTRTEPNTDLGKLLL